MAAIAAVPWAVLLGGTTATTAVTGALYGATKYFGRLPPNSPYDVVIDIDNICELPRKGWSVQIQEAEADRPSSDKPVTSSEKNLVAVLGQFNHGKTWCLSKLSSENLAKGQMVSTKGLSVKSSKHPTAKNFVLLDTEGSDACIPYEELAERRATESFLRELALHLSTVVIIVVNRLRRSDQVYLRSIVQRLYDETQRNINTKNAPKFKQLYILHNFVETDSLKDVKELIETEIEGVFNAERETLQIESYGETVYYRSSMVIPESTNNATISIQHFVVGKEGTEAGKAWNDRTIACMRQLIDSSIHSRRPYSFIEEVCQFTNERLSAYVRLPPTPAALTTNCAVLASNSTHIAASSTAKSFEDVKAIAKEATTAYDECAGAVRAATSAADAAATAAATITEAVATTLVASSTAVEAVRKASELATAAAKASKEALEAANAASVAIGHTNDLAREKLATAEHAANEALRANESAALIVTHFSEKVPSVRLSNGSIRYCKIGSLENEEAEKFKLLDLTFDDAGAITNVMSPQGVVRPQCNVKEASKWYDIHLDMAGFRREDLTTKATPHTIHIEATRSIPGAFQDPEGHYLRRDIAFGKILFSQRFSVQIDTVRKPLVERTGDLFFIRYYKFDQDAPTDIPLLG